MRHNRQVRKAENLENRAIEKSKNISTAKMRIITHKVISYKKLLHMLYKIFSIDKINTTSCTHVYIYMLCSPIYIYLQ